MPRRDSLVLLRFLGRDPVRFRAEDRPGHVCFGRRGEAFGAALPHPRPGPVQTALGFRAALQKRLADPRGVRVQTQTVSACVRRVFQSSGVQRPTGGLDLLGWMACFGHLDPFRRSTPFPAHVTEFPQENRKGPCTGVGPGTPHEPPCPGPGSGAGPPLVRKVSDGRLAGFPEGVRFVLPNQASAAASPEE